MNLLGAASRLAEGRDAVDGADEQHALLVDRRIAQAVGRRIAGVLGPDLVELARHPFAARLPFALLVVDRALELDPMVGVLGVDDQDGEARTLADPAALLCGARQCSPAPGRPRSRTT